MHSLTQNTYLNNELTMNIEYFKAITSALVTYREELFKSVQDIADNCELTAEQVEKIELGETNDLMMFFEYIKGAELYIFFEPKGADRNEPHDFEDMWNTYDKPTTMKDELVEKIKKVREAKDIKQGTLATMIGMSRQSYNNFENGRYDTAVTNFVKICNKLGISIELK